MGLMNKLGKMKTFFFDEDDEEKEERKNLKKEQKREIKKEQTKEKVETHIDNKKEIDELYFEDISEASVSTDNEIKSRSIKKEAEFKFPEFNDEDFMVSRVKPEPLIQVKKEEPKPILYQGSKRKEEKKSFKPSPIISPIYGLLDDEGKKIKTESNSKDLLLVRDKEESTFDEVRKKAYGSLDEELDNTIKKLSKKTIEEAENDMEKEEKELSRTKNKSKKKYDVEKAVIVEKELNLDEDDDDMILPNINFKEIDVDKEKNRTKDIKINKQNNINDDDDDDDDTKEQDLFNLIDTMYSGEENKD